MHAVRAIFRQFFRPEEPRAEALQAERSGGGRRRGGADHVYVSGSDHEEDARGDSEEDAGVFDRRYHEAIGCRKLLLSVLFCLPKIYLNYLFVFARLSISP